MQLGAMTGGNQRLQDRLRMKPLGFRNALLFENSGENDLVRETERLDKLALKDISPQRIRSRLKDRPQSRTWIRRAQGAQRLADSCRMMGKIVDDRDSVDDRLHLKPAFDARKGAQSLLDRGQLNSLASGQRCRGRGVQRVVLPGHWQCKLTPLRAAAKNSPLAMPLFLGECRQTPVRVSTETVAFDRTKRFCHTLGYILRTVKCNNSSAPRHEIDQPLERSLD